MTIPPSLFPLLLTTHVILAISLFLPAFLLPFTMRTRGTDGEPVVAANPGPFTRTLIWLEAHGTIIIGAGVAGLGAAWALKDSREVVVYEQDARVGGHANTVTIDYDGVPVRVVRPEYLVALYLEPSARTPKRQARAAMLLEWPGLNRGELDAILKRHDLSL